MSVSLKKSLFLRLTDVYSNDHRYILPLYVCRSLSDLFDG